MNAPNMITSNINSTKAKAAPEIPLLHPHPEFINIPPFLSLQCILRRNKIFVRVYYLVLKLKNICYNVYGGIENV
ncbi:MAG: hypothetical protein IJB82_00205 [Bacilli bacterium]|nr:hypothetical protein [Bacilli bacterium]